MGPHALEFTPYHPSMGRVFKDTYALDTETTIIDDNCPWLTPAYVLGAACDGHSGYFIRREHVYDFLAAHFDVPVVFHNAPFDLAVLQLVINNQLDLYQLVERHLVW